MDHYNVVHRGLNLHVCMYCDKSFGFKLNLSKHEKSEHSLDNVERKYGYGYTEQNLAELYDQSQETSQNPNKPSSGGRAVKRGRPKKSEKNNFRTVLVLSAIFSKTFSISVVKMGIKKLRLGH